MRIISEKIPAKFTALPELYELLNTHGNEAFVMVVSRLYQMNNTPNGATCTFKQVGLELLKVAEFDLYFKFYTSKNIFIGHNVISHADKLVNVNYNKRFHSVSKFTLKDWFKNFFHECTHLADQRSVYNFDHANQKDDLSAPMVVAKIAGEVFDLNAQKWL